MRCRRGVVPWALGCWQAGHRRISPLLAFSRVPPPPPLTAVCHRCPQPRSCRPWRCRRCRRRPPCSAGAAAAAPQHPPAPCGQGTHRVCAAGGWLALPPPLPLTACQPIPTLPHAATLPAPRPTSGCPAQCSPSFPPVEAAGRDSPAAGMGQGEGQGKGAVGCKGKAGLGSQRKRDPAIVVPGVLRFVGRPVPHRSRRCGPPA